MVPLLLAAAVAALASRSFSTGEAAADLSIPALSRTDVHATPLVAVADLHGDWQNALLSLQLTCVSFARLMCPLRADCASTPRSQRRCR